ncbi:MAG: hypothetical protein CXT67_01020 [Methanobacteriota archaeon]|jgi:hypothetical protein|nr:MAG: hypothetical protein CXT67_01020 [Euryarchaeota archaeon]
MREEYWNKLQGDMDNRNTAPLGQDANAFANHASFTLITTLPADAYYPHLPYNFETTSFDLMDRGNSGFPDNQKKGEIKYENKNN